MESNACFVLALVTASRSIDFGERRLPLQGCEPLRKHCEKPRRMSTHGGIVIEAGGPVSPCWRSMGFHSAYQSQDCIGLDIENRSTVLRQRTGGSGADAVMVIGQTLQQHGHDLRG